MAPWRFLRRIDFLMNSNVTLDSVSGTQLAMLMACTRRTMPLSLAPAAAGVSVQPFEANFMIDRALMDMLRSKDSMLKTDVGVSNLQARIQMGALSDMFTGAGVATYQEAADPNTKDTPKPYYYVKRNGILQTFAAAANQQQVKINTGNRLRMVSVQTLNSATSEPDATVLSRIRLKRAGDTRVDIDAALLRNAINRASYGFATPFTAHYVIDLANTGQLAGVRYSEWWPIPSSADTFLEVDLATAGILDIATIEGVDLARAA
jgi:hypothetical protein